MTTLEFPLGRDALVRRSVRLNVATLAYNLFGDGLRDVLDPRTQR